MLCPNFMVVSRLFSVIFGSCKTIGKKHPSTYTWTHKMAKTLNIKMNDGKQTIPLWYLMGSL